MFPFYEYRVQCHHCDNCDSDCYKLCQKLQHRMFSHKGPMKYFGDNIFLLCFDMFQYETIQAGETGSDFILKYLY